MAAGRTIYIAGAGIAGMTLALALAKFGATVVVLERNPRVQEVGAGLQISPNARRVLNQLGLDKAITARSFEPQAIDVYPYRASRPVVSLELGAVMHQRYGVPYAVMHRADLADALYRACKRFAISTCCSASAASTRPARRTRAPAGRRAEGTCARRRPRTARRPALQGR